MTDRRAPLLGYLYAPRELGGGTSHPARPYRVPRPRIRTPVNRRGALTPSGRGALGYEPTHHATLATDLTRPHSQYFAKHGEPLFSSHMLDLSEESIEENMEISAKYLKRMAAINCFLEVEIGITGGEEDGVDNSDANPEDLYSKPEEIHQVYQALNPVAPGMFSIAAAFGNVHGVYSPGNVKLTPTILQKGQAYIKEKEGLATDKPVYFVFHGGSGSSRKDIREAIGYGVIKMNIDTDTQWSFWDGVKDYVAEKSPYLQGQIGNPEGAEKPNKKYYDPRMWMRAAEEATCKRLLEAYEDLNATGAMTK